MGGNARGRCSTALGDEEAVAEKPARSINRNEDELD